MINAMQNWIPKVRRAIEKLPKNFRKGHSDALREVVSLNCRGPQDLARLLSARTNEELREFCAWFLGVIGDRRSVGALASALRTSSTGLIWESALAMAKIGGPDAERELITALTHGRSFDRKKAAIAALGNIASTRAVPHLLKILNNRRVSPKLRGEAAEALGKVGSDEVVGPLLEATHDKSPEVRFWAVFALGQTGARTAIARLEELAETDHSRLSGWGPISREAKNAKKQIVLRHRAD